MSLGQARVLISGANGAIGFHLARAISEISSEVHLVDNFSRSKNDRDFESLCAFENIKFHQLDLSHKNELDRLPSDFSHVFHLAAINGTRNFYQMPFDVLDSNIKSSLNLIEHFIGSPVLERFIYTGSSESYAGAVTQFGWEVPTTEEVPLVIEDIHNPRWSYGLSKTVGESAVINASHQFGLPFTVFRLHNVFGPRMGFDHFIPDFVQRALSGEFHLYGPSDTRSFIYVTDCVDAMIRATEDARSCGKIYNVGSDQERQILQVAKIIADLLSFDPKLISFETAPKGSVARRCPDVSSLKSLIGEFESIDFTKGLQETIFWVKNVSGNLF